MAERSNIEWCDSTFNPWIGCTKISPACDHCYAERDFDLRRHVVQWGAGQARKRTGADNWKKPGRWNTAGAAGRFRECGNCGWRGEIDTAEIDYHCPTCKAFEPLMHARRRVFCASLADVFDNEVPAAWRQDLFALIEATPNLDWLLLTKRIGNAEKMIHDARLSLVGSTRLIIPDVLPNIWIGATICNQAEADRDIPKLLSTPAAMRFVSIEPMLGPVDLTDIVVRHGGGTEDHFSALYDADDDEADTASYIDWVICGGESGPHARPMHPQWARDLRDQCAAAGVPFMFKQWGEYAPGTEGFASNGDVLHEQGVWSVRVGKKAAGRLLDGRTHDGFPEVRP